MGDIHRLENFLGLIGLCAFLSYRLGRLLHWSVGVAFGASAFSALRVFASNVSPYHFWDGRTMTALDSLSAGAFASLMAISVFILALNLRETKWLCTALWGAGVLNSVVMIFNSLSGQALGLMNNVSIDSSFVAATIPLVLRFGRPAFLAPMALAVILSKSSTGLAASVLAAGAFYWGAEGIKRNALLAGLAVGGALIAGKQFFDPNGRFEIWAVTWNYWVEKVDPWVGSGAGTYWFFGPLISQINQTPLVTWAHNDWLQILFEQGILGLISALILFGFMLIKSRSTPWLFAAILTYGFTGLTQMPLRLFIPSIFGAFLVKAAFTPGRY